jgi:thiosulfate/3-mercaptopyruvate sulfurtransferase
MYLSNMKRVQVFLSVLLLAFLLPRFGWAEVQQNHNLLVTTAWVQEHLHAEGVVILDTRDAKEYAKGHLPGAINIPVESTFAETGDINRVGSISQIRKLFSTHGVKNTDHMVLYDSGRLIDAARFFWVLEVYGHSKVSILDGGLAHWQKEKQPVQIAATTRPRSVYIPNISSRHLSNQLTTRLAMTKTKVSIIDARSSDDYSGKTSKAKRFGHIPTAINVPWSQNYQVMGDHMMLRPDNELEEIYSNQDTKSDVIAYCNRGKQSALTYLVLRKLGYNVSVYDGAWLEWGNDDSLPISSMRASSDGSL